MATTAQLEALTTEIAYLQGNLTRVETASAAAYVSAGDLDVAWLVLCGMPPARLDPAGCSTLHF